MKIQHEKIKVGDVYKTNKGGSFTVIKYTNCSRILIEHNDAAKHQAYTSSSHLRNGRVKNPYFPSVHGFGYMGVGRHRARKLGKITPAYNTWKNMIERCYSNKKQAKHPTYIGCSVYKGWHNFQVFAEWFYAQPNSGRQGFSLDKDLMFFGNKTYSESTCTFVPNIVNCVLLDSRAARGDLPQGVCSHRNSYRAHVNMYGKLVRLGTYPTPEQAHSAYKEAKEKYVKEIAEKHRDDLHPAVYENLMSWSLTD